MNSAAFASLPPTLPPRASSIALAGLMPFVLGALLVWFVREDVREHVSLALSVYAGLIVSFLGGIHWGLGMRHQGADAPQLFGWGVVSTLGAWVAVMMPASSGLVLEGVLLVACYLVDRKVYPREGIGHWLTLRFRLSASAALCCFLGAAGA